MDYVPQILAFAGSTRVASFNKKLLKVLGVAAAEKGAQVTYLDLRDYPLPLYDGDFEKENGLPENALKLKTLMLKHQGLLIASPEYNSSITGVLKNTLDWTSRPVPGEASLAAFAGKVAALCSASTGALGGIRGLVHLRAILGNINVLVLSEQIAIPQAQEAFDELGGLKDERKQATCKTIGQKLTTTLLKLNG